MRLSSRMLMPRWSARLSRRRWITSQCRAPSGRRTGSSRMMRRLRGIRSFRSRGISRGDPPFRRVSFVFLMDLCPDFFCVVDCPVFGEKRVFVRGVLWLVGGKMCGKRGLRDALFGVNWGRFGCRGSAVERIGLGKKAVRALRECPTSQNRDVGHPRSEDGAPGYYRN